MKDRAIKGYMTGGGQNLLINSNNVSWRHVINSWKNEIKNFSYGSKNDLSSVGHYTQIVWGETFNIGCSSKYCKKFYLYACQYYPGGNIANQLGIPYHIAIDGRQSCNRCKKGLICARSPQDIKGKLIEKCALLCTNQLSNCQDIKRKNACKYFEKDCALSCNNECRS
ncbi:unnamed protein product [Gordionus sp. m RMFG-2023]